MDVTCVRPYPTLGLRDPSWMQLGMAINAARHIGLDKAEDEVFFGMRRAKNQLSKHPLHIRRLTWLKAFELGENDSYSHVAPDH